MLPDIFIFFFLIDQHEYDYILEEYEERRKNVFTALQI